jgi:hypothetical protein
MMTLLTPNMETKDVVSSMTLKISWLKHNTISCQYIKLSMHRVLLWVSRTRAPIRLAFRLTHLRFLLVSATCWEGLRSILSSLGWQSPCSFVHRL